MQLFLVPQSIPRHPCCEASCGQNCRKIPLCNRAAATDDLALDESFFLRAVAAHLSVAYAAHAAMASTRRRSAYFTPDTVSGTKCSVANVAYCAVLRARRL